MASPQPAESPATNKRALVDGDVPDAVARYIEDLQLAPLATRTREAYASHVAAYGRWLTDSRVRLRRCWSHGGAITPRGTSSATSSSSRGGSPRR